MTRKGKGTDNNEAGEQDIEALFKQAQEARARKCFEEIQELLAKHRCAITVGLMLGENNFVPAEMLMKPPGAYRILPQ